MGVLTTAGKNALLDLIGAQGWYAEPFNGDPSGAGTALGAQTDEGRQAIDGFASAASGEVATNEAFTWTAAPSGSNITIDYIAFYDAATDGNLVGYGSVSSRTLEADETVTYPSGAITFTLTDPA
jgi:hypothetical protein